MGNQFDPTPGSPSPSAWPDVCSFMNRAPGSQAQAPKLASARSQSVGSYMSAGSSGRGSPAHLQRMLSEAVSSKDMFAALQSNYAHLNEKLPGGSSLLNAVGNSVGSSFQQGGQQQQSNMGGNFYDSAGGAGPLLNMALNEGLLKNQQMQQHAHNQSSDGESQSSSPEWMERAKEKLAEKYCCVCQSNRVVAALVPCGHNLFCMDCAEAVKEEGGECPACQRKVEAVLRIFS